MVTAQRIGATTFSTPSDQELVIVRVFDAPRRLVFDAYTKPQHLPHWMLGPEGWTMSVCEIDFRAGGAWRFGWRHADGHDMAMHGTYKEIVPPERVVTTESWGAEWPDTVNTVSFAESDGRTTVTTVIQYPSKAARDAAAQSGMQHGVNLSYERLAEYLGTLG